MERLTIEPLTELTDAATMMQDYADKYNCGVTAEFNGVELVANPGEEAQEIIRLYDDHRLARELAIAEQTKQDRIDALRFRKLEAALDAEYSFICDIDSGCSAGRYHPETGEPQSSYGKKFGALADALPDH